MMVNVISKGLASRRVLLLVSVLLLIGAIARAAAPQRFEQLKGSSSLPGPNLITVIRDNSDGRCWAMVNGQHGLSFFGPVPCE
jgi:hypothetical protein